MILRKLNPQARKNAVRWIWASAMLSFSISILLGQLAAPYIQSNWLEFLQGMLMGYSMVGNLFGLIVYRSEGCIPFGRR